VACLLALVVVLAVWAFNSRGGGGGKGSSAPTGSHTPVATITPGPTPTGTHISGRPGGRDTSGGDGGSSGGDTNGAASGGGSDSGGTTAGSGGTTAGGDTAGSGASSDTGGSGSGGSSDTGGSGSSAGSGGGSSTGGEVPVGSTLPDCSASAVALTLTSAQNSYGPGETPQFRLKAANSSGVSCKMDFGPRNAVFTVTKAADDSHVWASDDCPTAGAHLMEVPAHGTTTFTLRWNGKNSSPKCASPKGQAAQPGTYLVQAKMPGHDAKQASFVLSAD
jgi:hypothetical protein